MILFTIDLFANFKRFKNSKSPKNIKHKCSVLCVHLFVSTLISKNKETNKKNKERKVRSLTFFLAIFKERKKTKMKKKVRTNRMISGLPHRKRKEKKADKLSGKQADVTTERFFSF